MASLTLEQYTQILMFKLGDTIETKLGALNELCSFIRKHVAKNDYKNFDYDNEHEFIADIVAEIVHTHLVNGDDDDNLSKSVICYRTCQECERADTNARKIVALKRYVCNKCNTDLNENLESLSEADEKALGISKWTIIKLVTEAVLLVRCWVWGLCEKPWYILWKKKTKIDNKAL